MSDRNKFSGRPSVGYSLTTAIIKKALENLDADTDTEMMWYYLEKVGQIKMINLLKQPITVVKFA